MTITLRAKFEGKTSVCFDDNRKSERLYYYLRFRGVADRIVRYWRAQNSLQLTALPHTTSIFKR